MTSKTVSWIILVAGSLGCGICVFFPGGSSKHDAKRAACLSNLKQLATGAELYRQDYDDRFPSPTWLSQFRPYYKYPNELLVCPTRLRDKGENGYAMNRTWWESRQASGGTHGRLSYFLRSMGLPMVPSPVSPPETATDTTAKAATCPTSTATRSSS